MCIRDSSVTSLGNGAFYGCTGLSNATLSNSLTSIGYSTFIDCNKLIGIIIPNSVTSIGIYAFQQCSGLTTIVIPNSVTSIGEGAFSYCSGLTTITLGSGVTSIGTGAFSSCPSLKTINSLNATPPTLGSFLLTISNYTQAPVTDVFVPNITALRAYKANPSWIEYFPGNIIKTNVTYSVKVPPETNDCYIAGISNGWTFQQLNKVDATHYSTSIFTSTPDGYKYCSGSAWAYVEKDANGNEIADRSYSANDVVASWASIYTDVKTLNSNQTKLITSKSSIRAEFDGNARIEVCTLSGLLLRQAQATNTFIVDNLKAGLYIVKINGVAYKVVVR